MENILELLNQSVDAFVTGILTAVAAALVSGIFKKLSAAAPLNPEMHNKAIHATCEDARA